MMWFEIQELKFSLSIETRTKDLEKSKIEMPLLLEISFGDFSNIKWVFQFYTSKLLIAEAMYKHALSKQVLFMLILLGSMKTNKVQHDQQDSSLFERNFII